jgi:hypothetical protein
VSKLHAAASSQLATAWTTDLYPLVIVGGLLVGVAGLILLASRRRPLARTRRPEDS